MMTGAKEVTTIHARSSLINRNFLCMFLLFDLYLSFGKTRCIQRHAPVPIGAIHFSPTKTNLMSQSFEYFIPLRNDSDGSWANTFYRRVAERVFPSP
jgi:hypothetical protein